MTGISQSNSASRRAFLGATALSAASYNRVLGANDRIGVGFIGFGLIGKQHVADFKKFDGVELAAMCDVYQPRLEEGLQYMGNPRAKGYGDFRRLYDDKEVQAVVVSTPDHWHALLSIMACAAGKDVYVEKPMTVAIDEGKWMVQAARKFKRIVVVGTQRRQGTGVAEAKKVIEGGSLGKVHSVRIASYRNIYPGFGRTKVEEPPAGFDYDLWLGPAPKRPYQAHRGLYHFRWFWDYSGGQMTNLGAHLIDQVMWIMGVKGPTLVQSTGGRYVLEDDGETPDLQDALWVFPGFTLTCSIREANALRGDPAARGQVYLGTRGSLLLSGGFEVVPEMKIDPINDIPRFQGQPTGGPVYSQTRPEPWIQPSKGGVASDARYGTGGEDTMAMNERNWLDCIRTRKRPLCEVEDGHRVAATCHLANMSLRLGRSIRWDAEKESVIGDTEAAALCARPYRAPWDRVLRSIVKV